MSTSFVARFDTTGLKLEDILRAVKPVLHDHEIKCGSSIIELVPHNVWPTVNSLNFQAVEIDDVAKAAASWWGAGLTCVSQVLVKAIGRGSASEVDLSFFKSPANRWTMHYTEAGSATDCRIQSEEL